jgi:fermentation-respiration switch protein FrsA (DUF1100 family)
VSTTTTRRPVPTPVGTVAPTGSGRLLRTGIVATGAGLVVVVGKEGTPTWQAARVLVMLGLVIMVWRAARRGGAPGALASVGLGLVAVPVGVGIAVPHLAKTGLGVASLAGATTLVGGIVVLAGGIARLFRTVGRRWAVVTSVVVVLALAVLTFSLGQAVAATNVPRPAVGPATPADYGLRARAVHFRSRDGVRLAGWYVPSRNGAAVVLLHGAGSTRTDALPHAAVLARAGFGTLLYDARGHGQSAGRAMDFGWYGDDDLAGAVSFLRHRPDVRDGRIAALGLSMGGEEAIGALARLRALRAVVAEGATQRVASDTEWLPDAFGWRGVLTEGLQIATYAFADALTDADPPGALRDAVRAAGPRPVLLIAAGDVGDEARAGRFIAGGAPTVDLWVVPHTDHTQAIRTHPHEWRARVTRFLDRALDLGTGSDGP